MYKVLTFIFILSAIPITYFQWDEFLDDFKAYAKFLKRGFREEEIEPEYCDCPECQKEFENQTDEENLADKVHQWLKDKKHLAHVLVERLCYAMFFTTILYTAIYYFLNN